MKASGTVRRSRQGKGPENASRTEWGGPRKWRGPRRGCALPVGSRAVAGRGPLVPPTWRPLRAPRGEAGA